MALRNMASEPVKCRGTAHVNTRCKWAPAADTKASIQFAVTCVWRAASELPRVSSALIPALSERINNSGKLGRFILRWPSPTWIRQNTFPNVLIRIFRCCAESFVLLRPCSAFLPDVIEGLGALLQPASRGLKVPRSDRLVQHIYWETL